MWSCDISNTSIDSCEIEKNYLGKLFVKSANRVEIKDAEKWQEKLPLGIKNNDIALAIPDSKIFIQRIQIPMGFVGSALITTVLAKISEIIPVKPENLIFDYTVIKTDPKTQTQTILFAAIARDSLLEFYQGLNNFGAKLTFAVPESFTVFNVIKNIIKKGQTVLYIDIGAKISLLSFFDTYGPISTFSEPVETQKLELETGKVIAFFQKKYSKGVDLIILGGGGSLNITPDDFGKAIKLPVLKAENILDDLLKNLKIDFIIKDSPKMLFLNAISLGILTFQNIPLNLARKEMLGGKTGSMISSGGPGNSQETGAGENINKHQYFAHSNNRTGSQIIEKSKNNKRTFLLLLILVFIVAYLMFVLNSKNTNSKQEKPKTIASKIMPTQIKPLPTATPISKINREEITIQILNGTGKAGTASILSDLLRSKGYANIETGNATNSSFLKTVIRVRKTQEGLIDTIINDLKPDYKIGEKILDLENTSKYDVILIVGNE